MAFGSFYCLFFLTAILLSAGQAKKCPDPNARYTDCGTACPATCQNRQYANCIAVCVPGCFCKPDHIFDEISRKCVLIRNCPRY